MVWEKGSGSGSDIGKRTKRQGFPIFPPIHSSIINQSIILPLDQYEVVIFIMIILCVNNKCYYCTTF